MLEDFAYASEGRNRVIGSPGHNATIHWIKSVHEGLDGYYNVSFQEFRSSLLLFGGHVDSFRANGAVPPNDSYMLFDYSLPGNMTAPVVVVSNHGCEEVVLVLLM